jgi:hypothetical protein
MKSDELGTTPKHPETIDGKRRDKGNLINLSKRRDKGNFINLSKRIKRQNKGDVN